MKNTIRRLLCGYLVLFNAIFPAWQLGMYYRSIAAVATVFAFPRMAYAASATGGEAVDGQNFANALLGEGRIAKENADYTITADGQTTTNPVYAGTAVDTGPHINDAVNSYGNKTKLDGAIVTDLINLNATPGGTDRAGGYDIIKKGYATPRPPMGSSPVAIATKDIVTGVNPDVAAVMQGCTTTTTSTSTTAKTHVEDIRHCLISKPATPVCDTVRNITASAITNRPIFSFAGAVDDQLEFEFRVREPVVVPPGVKYGYADANSDGLPDGLLGPALSNAYASAYGGYYRETKETLHGDLPAAIQVYPFSTADIPDDATAKYYVDIYFIKNSGNVPSIVISQKPSAENGWVMKVSFYTPDSGEQYVDMSVYMSVQTMHQSFSDVPLGCRAQYLGVDLSPYFPSFSPTATDSDQASSAAWKCYDAFTTRTFGIVNLDSSAVGSVLGPLYGGEPTSPPAPICMHAAIRALSSVPFTSPICKNAGLDGNGQPIVDCPTADAANETGNCSTYEGNPSCVYLDSVYDKDPLTGATVGESRRYDCGTSVDHTTGMETTSETTCPGPISCMGTSCVKVVKETNKDMGEAASKLAMSDLIRTDTDCTAGGGCTFFKGTPGSCRIAWGGTSDCCEKPQGVSLVTYMQGMIASYHLADKIGAIDNLSRTMDITQTGVWQEASQAISTTYTDITKPITNAWEDMAKSIWSTAEPPPAAADTALVEQTANSIGLSAMTDKAIQKTGEWAIQNFPNTFGQLFATNGTTGAVTLSAGAQDALAAVSTFLTVVAIVNLAIMVVKIVYKCTDDEFQLASNRAMNLCIDVGEFCSERKALSTAVVMVGVPPVDAGPCSVMTYTFCCFKSPLAKIIRRAAYEQLGFSYGPDQSPTCSGLTTAHMNALDWDAIDWTEWTNTLKDIGSIPNGTPADINNKYSMENIITQKLTASQEAPKSSNTADVLNNILGDGNAAATRTQTGDSIRGSLTPP